MITSSEACDFDHFFFKDLHQNQLDATYLSALTLYNIIFIYIDSLPHNPDF